VRLSPEHKQRRRAALARQEEAGGALWRRPGWKEAECVHSTCEPELSTAARGKLAQAAGHFKRISEPPPESKEHSSKRKQWTGKLTTSDVLTRHEYIDADIGSQGRLRTPIGQRGAQQQRRVEGRRGQKQRYEEKVRARLAREEAKKSRVEAARDVKNAKEQLRYLEEAFAREAFHQKNLDKRKGHLTETGVLQRSSTLPGFNPGLRMSRGGAQKHMRRVANNLGSGIG
jgi:hypothetical protein